MKNRQLADLLETLADAIKEFGPKTPETYKQASPLLRHNNDFDSGGTGGGILWKKWNKANTAGNTLEADAWLEVMAICHACNPKLEKPMPTLPNGPAVFLRNIAKGLHQGRKSDDEVRLRRAIIEKHIKKSINEIQNILKTEGFEVSNNLIAVDKRRIREEKAEKEKATKSPNS